MSYIISETVAQRTGVGTVITTEEIVRDPGPLYRLSDTVNGVLDERTATAEEEALLVAWETEETLRTNQDTATVNLDTWAYVLRGWATDAASVVSQWDSATTGQKDAWMRTTIDRLGKLSDHLADLLVILQLKRDA